MIVYASNKKTVGDGARITRVSGGGQKLEVLVDPKDLIGGWSEVIVVSDAPPPPPPPAPNSPPVITTTAINIEV